MKLEITLFCVLALFFMLTEGLTAAPGADFYVATNGNDSGPGSLEKPFATVERAQQAVRALKKEQPGRSTPITVMVRGGTYFQTPLVFTPEDSGTMNAPVIYSAYPGEKPVFSGGRVIDGWKQDSKGRWQALILDVKRGKWNFQQLFVNGERRYRPRLPKEGYYIIADSVAETDPNQPGSSFKFNPGEIRADWSNRGDIDLLCFQVWTMARLPLSDVDEKNSIVTTTGKVWTKTHYGALLKGNRYIVENVKEAMGNPGEWYLDRKSGTLTYFPLPGEDMNSIEVVAPAAEQLLLIKGDVEKHRWVERITFRGLSFMYTNWTTPPEGYNFAQAEAAMEASVSAVGARYCTFEGCSISHTGIHGIELGTGCMYNQILECELTDLGAGAVKIGITGQLDDPEAVASFNTVMDCLIAHGGRMHPAGEGVWIGQAHHNTIMHNDIHDFYYSGISDGWSWGYYPNQTHHNMIEYNHIYDIGKRVLSDMGGIYTLGIQQETWLRHNLIHDIADVKYGGWGVYLDEGSSKILVENNIVYNTRSNPFFQHYGRSNDVKNNIFIMGSDGRIGYKYGSNGVFQRNIVYGTDGIIFDGSETARFLNNTYWPGNGTLSYGSQYRMGTRNFAISFQEAMVNPDTIVMLHTRKVITPAPGTRNFGVVPVIGNLSSEFPGADAWENALVLPDIVSPREDKALFPSDIRLLRDEKYLYFRIECQKNPPGADLQQTDMWKRSRVEFFLRPNMADPRTFQFGLSRDGRMEARIYPTLQELSESKHTVIDFEWTGRASEIEDGWCAEARFPIDKMAAYCGGSTDTWGFFLGRVDRRGGDLESRIKMKEETGSIIADPMFVDPTEHDYRLAPDSPAYKAGFRPFDLSTAGSRVKHEDPDVPKAYPPADPDAVQ